MRRADPGVIHESQDDKGECGASLIRSNHLHACRKKQVEERMAIGANVVYETIRREGDEEMQRPAAALAWSGLAAGLSMGFSFIAEAVLMAHLPDAPWRPLISRAGYCVGFLIVILGRQQLFTENTLTVILPLLLRKNLPTLLKVLRLWTIVLSANLVGTFLLALTLSRIVLFDPHTQAMFLDISRAHFGADFSTVTVRAIFAGWLIALMVWLLPSAESARVSIIIIITYLVGIAGFNHIVAGSTTVLYLLLTGSHFLWHVFRSLLHSHAPRQHCRRSVVGGRFGPCPGSRREELSSSIVAISRPD